MVRTTIRLFCISILTGLLLISGTPYTAPDGDLNMDGQVSVSDVQCQVLLYSRLTADGAVAGNLCAEDADCIALFGPGHQCRQGFTQFSQCLPVCLGEAVGLGPLQATDCTDMGEGAEHDKCLGKVAKHNADFNCDGQFGNEDFTFLIAILLGKLGFGGSADHDGDGRLNFCDNDSDGDALADPVDCAPLDAAVSDCDDGDPCTQDACDAKVCIHTPLPDQSSCDDNDGCTTGDQCLLGQCTGMPMVCVDGLPCTSDSCQNGQCVFTPIPGCNNCPGGCDDGDPCTSDTCEGSSCKHNAIWGCTTCANSCGGQSPYNCWCDEACFWGSDCCMDVCEHCNFCAGKACGPDSCGNWCGFCPWPQECLAGGFCL